MATNISIDCDGCGCELPNASVEVAMQINAYDRETGQVVQTLFGWDCGCALKLTKAVRKVAGKSDLGPDNVRPDPPKRKMRDPEAPPPVDVWTEPEAYPEQDEVTEPESAPEPTKEEIKPAPRRVDPDPDPDPPPLPYPSETPDDPDDPRIIKPVESTDEQP